jgi:hypothetical protein
MTRAASRAIPSEIVYGNQALLRGAAALYFKRTGAFKEYVREHQHWSLDKDDVLSQEIYVAVESGIKRFISDLLDAAADAIVHLVLVTA